MSTKIRNSLLYLILLLLSGQTIASPFLVCPHMSAGTHHAMLPDLAEQHGDAAALTEHCGGMHMTVSDEDASLDTPHGHHAVAIPDSSLGQGVLMDPDCDPACSLLCLGAGAPAVPVPAMVQGAATIPTLLSSAELLPPGQPPEVHFRPPSSC